MAVLGIGFQQPLVLQKTGNALCDGMGTLIEFFVRRRLDPAKPCDGSGTVHIDTVEEQHVEVNGAFMFSALPKRWTSVTAPVLDVVFVSPAFRLRCVAIVR